SHRMLAQQPIATSSGTVRITDSKVFPASTTISAVLVEVMPGGMRELHWHPNTDEWQYYIEGQGRMGVFAGAGHAGTFDFRAGDVGYVPFAMGHYVENTGMAPLRFLEMFRSSYYADVSLDQWMALTPPELIEAHLGLDRRTIEALRKEKKPVVPAKMEDRYGRPLRNLRVSVTDGSNLRCQYCIAKANHVWLRRESMT